MGLVHYFVVFDDGLFGMLFNAAIMAGLTLAVSRKRWNWARWVLTVLFALGLAMMLWMRADVLSIGYPVVTIGVAVLQAIALALLFTRQSSRWLRKEPVSAEA